MKNNLSIYGWNSRGIHGRRINKWLERLNWESLPEHGLKGQSDEKHGEMDNTAKNFKMCILEFQQIFSSLIGQNIENRKNKIVIWKTKLWAGKQKKIKQNKEFSDWEPSNNTVKRQTSRLGW